MFRTYQKDYTIGDVLYRVYGVYEDGATPKYEYEYYDIYSVDKNGQETLLTGEYDFPYPDFPSEQEVTAIISHLG